MIFVVDVDGSLAAAWMQVLQECTARRERAFPHGVHAATNPALTNGRPVYWLPAALEDSCSLCSARGLILSDPAYIERAVLPFAHWSRSARPDRWLRDLVTVMLDAGMRAYPLWLAHTEALEDGGASATEFASWLGASSNTKSSHRAQEPPALEFVPSSEERELLNEVFARLVSRAEMEPAFLSRIDIALEKMHLRSRSDH